MKILLILLLALLLSSCEGVVSGSGKIASSADAKPIDNVLVHWVNQDIDSYSDSSGHFEIGAFVGCPTRCPDLEVTFSKRGYKPKYLNLDKTEHQIDSLGRNVFLVTMTPTDKAEVLENGRFSVPLLILEILTSLLNVATLVYIVITKPKYRIAWLIAIILFSATIRYNYFDNTFEGQFFSFLLRFKNDFGWYTYFIPTTAILFWANYFIDKNKSSTHKMDL